MLVREVSVEFVGRISRHWNKLKISSYSKAKSMPSKNLLLLSLLQELIINRTYRSVPTVDVLVTRTGAFAVHYEILLQRRPRFDRNLDVSGP